MFKKTTLLALLFSSLFLVGCNLGGGAPAGFDTGDASDEAAAVELPDVIKIGYIGPLTGNAAGYGQDMKAGIELYFSENHTIGDSTVEVIYEDGKCNGQDAANAAQKLINIDKVQVILGGQCSGETLAAAPIAEANKVLLFSSLSSSPDVTTAGDYVFRNYPSDEQVAKTMVDDILAHGYESVAVLTEQSDYAQAYRGAIARHLATAGKESVLDEPFAADNTDFRTLLAKVQESGADVLIVIPQSPVVGAFAVKQAAELGLNIQIYGGDTLPAPDFFDTAKDAAEGVKVVMVAEDPSRSGYSEKAAELPAPQSAAVIPLFGYDAANIVANGIAAVGYDGTALKDYLYSMPTFKGVASDVKFDENGDNNVSAGVKVAKDGEFVFVTE
ncbi:ABC transporter substrate-binding protein [Patescibacteria group bacterium]|nr:ABC transporter substrate-binding protein [Patescibacteria group bacterium]MBU1016504.1 ABC transporter substrate-binding protein [Patescibacteria group bacterium]MBU1685117.1 ABC transporter substrate-binding protein [Patescibacteria group bacterium]MBU1938617.1 ABC transporter substrate-binding protein [Patescibacteria group bacterium]